MSKPESDMLDELRGLLGTPIPPRAMTFRQIYDALRKQDPNLPEATVRKMLGDFVREGSWSKRRSGAQVYWWKND